MKTAFLILNTIFFLYSCQAHSTQEPTQTSMDVKKLIQAIDNNDTTTLITALENGANVNGVDAENRSLLLIATNKANTAIAKILVKYGANVNQQAKNLDSPFLFAGASGQTELVELYLKNGARFDIYNRYYGTALIPACERGHIETVQLLANTKNFPIDHINRLGWTGLMEAVILGDGSYKFQRIVEILKKAGAKLDIPDHEGITPLQHAKNRGYTEIVKILQG